MTDSKPKNRRATVLIDREFQLRFIGRLGGVLFFYLMLFLVISVVAPVVFTFLGDPPEWALMETAFRVEVLLRLILAPLVCTFLCLFAHGVLETFRIAGPNYRFKQVFKDLTVLRLPRGVKTRKGDYLRDTTAAFSTALTALHDELRQIQAASAVATMRVKDALAEPANAESARRALEAVTQVDGALARFELVSCAPECRKIERAETPVEPLVDYSAGMAPAAPAAVDETVSR